MEPLIILVVNLTDLLCNNEVLRRNQDIYLDQIKQLERTMSNLLIDKKIAFDGYIIADDGIHRPPTGWRDLVYKPTEMK